MRDARVTRYADAIERVWQLDPDAASVIERHVTELRRECARRRVKGRAAAQAQPGRGP